MSLARKLRTLVDRSILEVSKLGVPARVIAVRQTRFHGLDLLVLANEDVGRRICFLGRYEERDLEYLGSAIRSEDTCLDIGASTGAVTSLMAARARRGVVYAFEPEPLSYSLLCANAELNVLPIQPFAVAVSDRAGRALFSRSRDSSYSSLIPTGRDREIGQISVETVTICEFVQRQRVRRVDIVKVDVEGAEELVLRGGAGVFRDAESCPRLLMVELFDRNLAVFGTTISHVLQLMGSYGYTPFVHLGGGRKERFGSKHFNRNYNVFFERDGGC